MRPMETEEQAPNGLIRRLPMIIARVMTSKNSKQTLQTRANKTPPPSRPLAALYGKDFGSDSESACPSGAYNTNTQPGTCLWTGEAQSPPYTSTKFYAGWLNGDNQENCAKTIGKEVDAPVIDGCRFADDGTTISEAVGCSTVWVTDYTFKQLGGKPGLTQSKSQTGTLRREVTEETSARLASRFLITDNFHPWLSIYMAQPYG
ncbi:hypothetical protein H4Q26_002711 [Puccinia striiformis f. sp. tritici PST-130]|nr:hypothetical protein H4Q26_002711 [Puccinia striiformis f. sp. tritici PST-130]